MRAAALAGGLLLAGSTGLASASCERRRKTNVIDPHTYPVNNSDEDDDSDVKDPMTIYAKHAIHKEMAEEGQQAQESTPVDATSKVEEESEVQATSTSVKIETSPSKYSGGGMSADELRIEEATRKAKQHSGGLKIFSGNGNMALALDIAKHLGINLGKATVGRFADGECNVVINENIRGKDVYVIQPTCPPVNDNMMELLLMVSTLRRASARRITVVIPYYGYARQDRKMQVCMVYFCVYAIFQLLIVVFSLYILCS